VNEVERNRALVNSMIEILQLMATDKNTFHLVLSNTAFAAEWWNFVIFDIDSKQALEEFLIANIAQVSVLFERNHSLFMNNSLLIKKEVG
jgi:hypothetical protein